MIRSIRPTSKASLKTQCLLIANGDIDKAERLYDFMAKDMGDLPLFDPIQPTTMQQAQSMISQGFTWINENQETIMNWVGFFKQMIGKGNAPIATPTTGATAIPTINP